MLVDSILDEMFDTHERRKAKRVVGAFFIFYALAAVLSLGFVAALIWGIIKIAGAIA